MPANASGAPRQVSILWRQIGFRYAIPLSCSELPQRISILTASFAERLSAPALLDRAPDSASILAQTFGDLLGSFRARDGTEVAWRVDDAVSACVQIAVAPVRPGHSVSVEFRMDGGPVTELVATPEWRSPASGQRDYTALLPRAPIGALEVLPVLRFAGQPISPRMSEGPSAVSGPASRSAAPAPPSPVWGWSTKFVATMTATVGRQNVGEGPDGLRIDWLIEEGRFAGPEIKAVVLPGAVDFMRIRRDGLAIVDVRACLETADGARIYAAYGGALDLGPDGYARALRGQFATMPPLVVAPTFETSDARLRWLNRVRCFGVGRVDTHALTYVFDVYAAEVGQRADGGRAAGPQQTKLSESLPQNR